MRIDSLEELRIRFEWNAHIEFLDKVQSGLNDVAAGFALEIKQRAEQIDDECSRDQFHESRIEDLLEFERYHTILRNSYFVSAYSLFEDHILMICAYAKRHLDTPWDIADVRGGSIMERVKLYFKRLGIQSPSTEAEWSDLHRYRSIRNKVVHNGGRVLARWGSFAFSKKKGVISGKQEPYELALTRDFCEEASKTFRRFLLKTCRNVQ